MALDEWVEAVTARLQIPPDSVPVDVLLDLARDVAHGVDRPAAPVTAFVVGYAVATRGGDKAALESALADVRAALAGWPP